MRERGGEKGEGEGGGRRGGGDSNYGWGTWGLQMENTVLGMGTC